MKKCENCIHAVVCKMKDIGHQLGINVAEICEHHLYEQEVLDAIKLKRSVHESLQ